VNDIIFEILEVLNLQYETVLKKKFGAAPEILAGPTVRAIIESKSLTKAGEKLQANEKRMQRAVKELSPRTRLSGATTWRFYLLDLVGKRFCNKCDAVFDYEESCHTRSICKACDNERSKEYRKQNPEACRERSKKHYYDNKQDYIARNARRRAAELERTPKWANLEAIKEIYRNCPEGHHVDHIIPLQGEKVSGLHVENNLQYLPAGENLSKANKFE
jgi:hypothetical protein